MPLWKVMGQGGFLEKYGVEIELGSMEGLRKKATEALSMGELDVISGNHHNLYAARALRGDPFVHVAQTNNAWRENWLVARKGIRGIRELAGC